MNLHLLSSCCPTTLRAGLIMVNIYKQTKVSRNCSEIENQLDVLLPSQTAHHGSEEPFPSYPTTIITSSSGSTSLQANTCG